MMNVKSAAAGVLLGALVATGVSLTALPSASAANLCGAERQRQVINNAPDKWRVRAHCSQLNRDTKARGHLGGTLGQHTQWFTALNRSYYSGYYTYITTPSVGVQYDDV